MAKLTCLPAEAIALLRAHAISGKTRADLMAKFCAEYDISRASFDRAWKNAREVREDVVAKAEAEAEKIVEKKLTKRLAEIQVEGILDKTEKLLILSAIARNQDYVCDPDTGEKTLVPWNFKTSERINAISELNRMQGDYAPTKVAATDKNGEDLPAYDLTKATDNDLRALAALQSTCRTGTA